MVFIVEVRGGVRSDKDLGSCEMSCSGWEEVPQTDLLASCCDRHGGLTLVMYGWLLPASPTSSVAASFLSSPQAHSLSYSSLSTLCSLYFIVLLFVAISTNLFPTYFICQVIIDTTIQNSADTFFKWYFFSFPLDQHPLHHKVLCMPILWLLLTLVIK